MPSHERVPSARALNALTHGVLHVEGRLPWSSNASFLLRVEHDGVQSRAVYKPEQGEQPLWDFPPGLARREVAAYELAKALGWPAIPETVVRTDAPLGPGSLQRFVDADFAQHYFTLIDEPRHRDALTAIAVFDVIVNNADRKGGHFLLGPHDHKEGEHEDLRNGDSGNGDDIIWAIDHGLCFHEEPKLRTVAWDYAGDEIPKTLQNDIGRIAGELPCALRELLTPQEIDALLQRIAAVANTPVLPALVSQRQYPWPLI